MEISKEIIVGELLRQQAIRLAVAESCTGGLIAHRITNVPGSSVYFVGGVISYLSETKERILGIRHETIQKFGAVSQETAIEMARQVRLLLYADIGLSITGIAGPSGGSAEHPVGLTWIGISTPQQDQAWKYQWHGNRMENKDSSVEQALHLLILTLSDEL